MTGKAKKADETVRGIKGFNPDLTCRGFQFAEGGVFEHVGAVELCRGGFHAVTNPLEVFNYYPPGTSVYREVELEGVDPKTDGDSKVAGRKITIGAEVGIPGLVKAHIEFVLSNVKKEKEPGSHTDKDRSASSATGYQSASSATGDRSASSATGYRSASSATGDRSASSATGDRSASLTTGLEGQSKVDGEESVAIATGRGGKAGGKKGCWIVLTERDAQWHILGVQAVLVDGDQIKEDVLYTLRGGKVAKA
ncbi:MAG: hypothetical protein ABIQ01_04910 [Pseudolysinimonas sp.]